MSLVTFIDDVPVFGDFAYFDDWLKANGYKTQSEIREDYLMNDKEDELEEALDELSDQFNDWCDNNGFIANDC